MVENNVKGIVTNSKTAIQIHAQVSILTSILGEDRDNFKVKLGVSLSFASNSIHAISNYKNQKYTYFQHPINWIYKYEVKNWKNQIITGA